MRVPRAIGIVRATTNNGIGEGAVGRLLVRVAVPDPRDPVSPGAIALYKELDAAPNGSD